MDEQLQTLEAELVLTDEDNFHNFVYGQSWPEYAIVSEQSQGMPWEQAAPGKRRSGPPKEMRCIQIVYETGD